MSTTATKPRFDPGVLLATPGASEAFERNGQTPFEFLQRHINGDWGEGLCQEDRMLNGVRSANTIVSATGEPIAGGGAQLENLSAVEQARIQAFTNRYGTDVTVVGSRASGTAGPMSDFDYLIGGNSRLRANARVQLPRGAAGGEIGPRGETGIDIFNANREALDPTRPHIIFRPQPGQGG